ncbi:MAG: hypothetical protein KJO43_07540 [Phycisphaerae bacterium]|nr:hypothetical protein [Phycisphaerae bacterium]NNF43492.1 hypothetical protein [Phycisphaerales bacterium]
MLRTTTMSALILVSCPLLLAHPAAGQRDVTDGGPSSLVPQCPAETFEDFALGANATSLVPGVTITAEPGSCGGPGSVLPIIVAPSGGTISGTRALGLQTGCPDFSPDYLRLVFDEPQSEVRFVVGVEIGSAGLDLEIRAYDSGGGLISNQTIMSAGGTRALVVVTDFLDDIRRIEIEQPLGFFETLDDLEFGADVTPPLVDISSPGFDACICGDTLVSIGGSVDDPDGDYGCDTLFYRPVNADADDPWVELSTACGAFTGTLHTWDTTGVPHGRYYLRVAGSNGCGLVSSDTTVVFVDRQFGSKGISAPTAGETICGTIDVDGGVGDHCGIALWTLDYAPAGTTAFTTIASGTSGVSCTIAEWNTTKVPDGDYTLRLSAEDNCGHSDPPTLVAVTIDNSGFCDCGPDINGDGVVDFVDLLLVLANWTL